MAWCGVVWRGVVLRCIALRFPARTLPRGQMEARVYPRVGARVPCQTGYTNQRSNEGPAARAQASTIVNPQRARTLAAGREAANETLERIGKVVGHDVRCRIGLRRAGLHMQRCATPPLDSGRRSLWCLNACAVRHRIATPPRSTRDSCDEFSSQRRRADATSPHPCGARARHQCVAYRGS